MHSTFILFRLVRGFNFFFSKQKTAYELPISDWSSAVCSSDLPGALVGHQLVSPPANAPARDDAIWPAWPIKLVSDHVEAKLGSAVNRLQGLIGHAPCCTDALETGNRLARVTGNAQIGRAACRERGGKSV